MKLINSNKFKEKLNYLNYELYNSHPFGELSKEKKDIVSQYIYHISKMVDNMPTVEAISMDFINKKLEWYKRREEWHDDSDFPGVNDAETSRETIEYLIKDWKKENEQGDN